MFNLKAVIFALVFLLSASSFAMTCDKFLENGSSTATAVVLYPSIQKLVQGVDYRLDSDSADVAPMPTYITYGLAEMNMISDLPIPLDDFGKNDRILETDYGYALFNADELMYWSELDKISASGYGAQTFIDHVATHRDYYPLGLTKEAADWLRENIFAHEESFRTAAEGLSDSRTNQNLVQLLERQKNEFKEIVKRDQTLVFPLNFDGGDDYKVIGTQDAQAVLEVLNMHFLLSNTFVKSHEGAHVKLSEILNRDSLLLLARFPALFPAYSIFEGGHFKVDYSNTIIGQNDVYTLVRRDLPQIDHAQGADVFTHFYSSARDSINNYGESQLEVSGRFRVNVDSESSGVYRLISSELDKVFSLEQDRMDSFLADKTDAFERATGFVMPVSTVIEIKSAELFSRDFEVSFGDVEIPQHILAAFYVFAGLD